MNLLLIINLNLDFILKFYLLSFLQDFSQIEKQNLILLVICIETYIKIFKRVCNVKI